MAGFDIALSGIDAAQVALEVIGNNVANAATEGYHRQRVEVVPASNTQSDGRAEGGVEVAGVMRLIDQLLEREIIGQQSAYGQVSQELSVLSTLETTFGEFSEGMGLNESIDAFFDALRNLAAAPLDDVARSATVSAAQALTAEFRRLGASVTSMEDQVVLEAQNTVDSINLLINQIAELNAKIQSVEISHGQANNLRDHRDQLISQLAEFVDIETMTREYGVVDVSIAGLPVVTNAIPVEIAVGLRNDQTLSVMAADGEGYSLGVQGGKLGGLLSLKNELLAKVRGDLDTLAQALVAQVNQYHAQGVGMGGSFTELTGWIMDRTDLSTGDSAITDGAFYIRVTNGSTGAVERYRIDVDVSGPTPDTLETIAAKIDAIAGLNASVTSSRLHVAADLGYRFDFIPAVLPEPSVTNFTAGSAPTVAVSGIYDGTGNDTFTFTVVGSGSVGNGSLRLEVTDQAGNVCNTLNIGSGYAAGDVLEMTNGIKIAVGSGDLNDGDSFDVEAFATTDTSGLLAAAGMNAFFSGASASEMQLCQAIVDTPDRIATAVGGDLLDNVAALQLSQLREEELDALGGLTPGEYYQRTVASLGQQIALKQSQRDNVEAMIQNLETQKSDLSGVDINDEAAQILVYEQMFQAMAKYLNTVQDTMMTLMQVVR
ncbi:MAG: flagellar hook-associated protein FlgK [Sedimentisphaerales bacterium]|nr:flagellar hook-associated protein FlgK [Sedimentisphaerales bacterium]